MPKPRLLRRMLTVRPPPLYLEKNVNCGTIGVIMSKPEYEITKEDIATMLEYLRATAPEHATPERAIYLLEHYNIHYKKLEELYPEVIEDILKDFETR